MTDPRVTWHEEYRQSLKAVEMEEPLDLALYRPLAFLLTKALKNTPATPNQVSVASLFCGILAGYLFWQGTAPMAALGALAYFSCNVLDCADGQLARLRGTPSPFGYIVDGSIDYAASVAVFVGMAHGLVVRHPGEWPWWWLCTASGLSYAWQCAILDRKRVEWGYLVYQRKKSAAEQLEFFQEHLARYRQERSHYIDRVLILIFITYHSVWTRLTPNEEAPPTYAGAAAQAWQARHKPVLRAALLMGPTMQMTFIMLAAGFGVPDYYLILTLTLGNAYAMYILWMQRRAEMRFLKELPSLQAPTLMLPEDAPTLTLPRSLGRRGAA